MKTIILTAFVLALSTLPASALTQYSSEDTSRFRSKDYTKAEPGMLKPSEYVERAIKALHLRYRDLDFKKIKLAGVTHRFYADAPPADKDIICVTFAYQMRLAAQSESGGALPAVMPALLVLIRRDLTKVYVNEVYYQFE
ncbi:MAG: hypothetical protein ACREIF_08655 [Chthoniobacterales bacterium]